MPGNGYNFVVIIPVRADIDVFKARRAGRELAREIGFNSKDYAFIELAVSELATNIIKHAGGGKIKLVPIEGGLEIVSEDQGPGINDVEEALKGRRKSLHGLGVGLSGVRRTMDQLEINSEKGRGTLITARKWMVRPLHLIKPKQESNVPSNGLMKYGVISNALFGSGFNGDSYVIREFDGNSLIAVIDGLGHGQTAYVVAQEAADYVQKNYRKSLVSILEGCHKALRGTRGVVMGLVKVDFEGSRLFFSGVGNIGIRVVGKKPVKPISVPGIIGHNVKKLFEEGFPYTRGDTIFIYSDGISDRFVDPGKPDLKGKGLQEIAEEIVREFGRDQDDATIVAAREE